MTVERREDHPERPTDSGATGREDDALTPSEREAEALLRRRSGTDEPVLRAVEREMETLLEHLADLRMLHSDLDKDLVRSECRVRTDLLRATARPYVIDTANPNHPFNESPRQSLKRRLDDLARERRSVNQDIRLRRTALLDRLSSLLERHRQIGGTSRGV
ncbi:MAG: hypothetical protein WAZ94_08445 [Phycisphaerales bacterium]